MRNEAYFKAQVQANFKFYSLNVFGLIATEDWVDTQRLLTSPVAYCIAIRHYSIVWLTWPG